MSECMIADRKNYIVTVDYLTSFRIIVNAENEGQAERFVEGMIRSKDDELLRRAAVRPNWDGFEVAYVEEPDAITADVYAN